MSQGRTLEGVVVPDGWRPGRCRVCGAVIWWGTTAAGKRCPFDVKLNGDALEATAITHFSTCPEVRQFEHGRGRR